MAEKNVYMQYEVRVILAMIYLNCIFFFSSDTRLMYCDLVERIVKAKVEEFTAAKGVKLVDFKSNERLAQEMVTAYLKQIRQ